MLQVSRIMLIALSSVALMAGASGCKRAADNGGTSMGQASSGVMSNSASPSGTADSDAAKRANGEAGAGASATASASDAAAVRSTPASAASTTQ